MRRTGMVAAATLCVASCAFALTIRPEGGAIVSAHKNYDVVAKDLQRHLKLIAGVELPLVAEKDAPANAFVWRVGVVPPGEDGARFKPEEGRWKITEKGAWFYGDATVEPKSMAKTGVEMGVYAFLEDELGCRWPWFDAISVREQNPIVVGNAEGGWVPPFRLRAIRSRDAYVEWRARMRDGRHDMPSYGHAFHAYWKRFASTHPEFFGMRRDGKRFPPDAPDDMTNPAVYAGKMGSAIAMCVSCDGLVDQLVEDWKAGGMKEYVNLCENDATGDNRCHCPKCEALDEPPPPGSTNVWQNWFADRYVDFSNRVLEKARKFRPDVKACFYAYNMTEIAPRRVKTVPGVSVGVVPTIFTPARIRKYLRDWKAAGFNDFFYRPNRHHYYKSYHMPLGNDEYFFDIFKVVVAENPIGFDYDSGPNLDVLNFFRDYVIYKGMQDPSKDFAYWENHYCEAFGAAKEDVKGYFKFWRGIWKERIESHVEEYTKVGFDFGRPFLTRLGRFYSLDDYGRGEAFLDRGLSRPGLTDNHRALVREMKDAFVHARLFYAATTKRCDGNAKALYDYRVAHGIVPVLWHESYYNDLCGVYDYMKRNRPADEVAKLPQYVRNHESRRLKRAAEARARATAKKK